MQLTFESTPKMDVLNKSKLIMKEISFNTAKKIIIKNHYTHSVNSMTQISIGFFVDDWLGGVITYGSPVGRLTIKSIDSNLMEGEVLELTRLFAFDWLGKNTESRMIGLSIKHIKKKYPKIKCLISYADPNKKHMGTIYQATNWKYQGNLQLLESREYKINNKIVHSRTVISRYGTTNMEILKNINSSIEEIFIEHKHRYIYPLTKLNLKHPIKPYPKKSSCVGGVDKCTALIHSEGGGVIPTSTHHTTSTYSISNYSFEGQ